MSTVLCFGDSNTWGTIPSSVIKDKPGQAEERVQKQMQRYDMSERWSALLQSLLPQMTIIEEGQPSRTLVHNNPFDGEKGGQRYLKDCLEMYEPDLVLILLGTNDLKKRFALTAETIAKSAACLAKQVIHFKSPSMQSAIKVLLISPPPVYEVGFYANMYQGAATKSKDLAKHYALQAQQVGCGFFDAGSVVISCQKEGIHWQADQHRFLANALVPIIKSILEE